MQQRICAADTLFWPLVNKACRHWHAAYSAAAIAIRVYRTAVIGATASTPTETHTMLSYSGLKLKVPIKFTKKSN